MSRRIAPDQPAALVTLRVQAIPLGTTMAGSALGLLPIVADWPALPPFGLLMLLGWRLLRPELWPAWIGLPLGLFDDLMSGLPIGSSMFLWTGTLLLLDIVDSRFIWRDYWVDWLLASLLVVACTAGAIPLSGVSESGPALLVSIPRIAFAILCIPIVMRLCLHLDRLRLGR